MITARRLLALGALFITAALFAAEISIDADRTADYTAFKTYSWKDNDKAANPAVDSAIVADIEEQLAAKGLHKTDKAPDLVVKYHAVLRKDVKYTDWDEGKFKLENRNITIEKLTVGTLVIDIAEAKEGKLLWRAAVSETLKGSTATPEFMDSLKKNIALMFTQYPPKKA